MTGCFKSCIFYVRTMRWLSCSWFLKLQSNCFMPWVFHDWAIVTNHFWLVSVEELRRLFLIKFVFNVFIYLFNKFIWRHQHPHRWLRKAAMLKTHNTKTHKSPPHPTPMPAAALIIYVYFTYKDNITIKHDVHFLFYFPRRHFHCIYFRQKVMLWINVKKKTRQSVSKKMNFKSVNLKGILAIGKLYIFSNQSISVHLNAVKMKEQISLNLDNLS